MAGNLPVLPFLLPDSTTKLATTQHHVYQQSRLAEQVRRVSTGD